MDIPLMLAIDATQKLLSDFGIKLNLSDDGIKELEGKIGFKLSEEEKNACKGGKVNLPSALPNDSEGGA